MDNVIQLEQEPKKIKTGKNRAGRKRNKNSPLAPSRMYFNAGTKDAILDFQSATSDIEKEKIYKQRILPAFEKLVDNLINIHKFAVHDDIDIMRNDAIVFLFETLRKYDPLKGANAFSYFNVVAKNFLIIKSKQSLLYYKRNADIDEPETMLDYEIRTLEERCTIVIDDEKSEKTFLDNILSLLDQIRADVELETELVCVNAIITLFENLEHIDLLNKNAVLKYLQEISHLNSKQLSIALQSIKKLFKQYRAEDVAMGIFL